MSERTDPQIAAPSTESTLVPCFVCGKELPRVFESEMQPSGGVMCRTSGNYGSRVLDCFHEPGVMFLLCDNCLILGAERVRTVIVTQARPETRFERWEHGHAD